MAPPLLPITRLVVCSSCAEHVKSTDDACPHCGAVLPTRQGLLARAAGVALAGVMLASCTDGKGGTATQGSTGGDTEDTDTDTDTDSASGGTTSGSETTAGSESLSDTAQPAYGVPTSDFTTEPTPNTDTSATTVDPSSSGSDSSGDTDPGTSSMTGGPEYGVPDTGGPEPDYGVPGTT